MVMETARCEEDVMFLYVQHNSAKVLWARASEMAIFMATHLKVVL
jgi:hypothetical protein